MSILQLHTASILCILLLLVILAKGFLLDLKYLRTRHFQGMTLKNIILISENSFLYVRKVLLLLLFECIFYMWNILKSIFEKVKIHVNKK